MRTVVSWPGFAVTSKSGSARRSSSLTTSSVAGGVSCQTPSPVWLANLHKRQCDLQTCFGLARSPESHFKRSLATRINAMDKCALQTDMQAVAIETTVRRCGGRAHIDELTRIGRNARLRLLAALLLAAYLLLCSLRGLRTQYHNQGCCLLTACRICFAVSSTQATVTWGVWRAHNGELAGICSAVHMLRAALILANAVLFWLRGLSPRYRGSHTNQQQAYRSRAAKACRHEDCRTCACLTKTRKGALLVLL